MVGDNRRRGRGAGRGRGQRRPCVLARTGHVSWVLVHTGEEGEEVRVASELRTRRIRGTGASCRGRMEQRPVSRAIAERRDRRDDCGTRGNGYGELRIGYAWEYRCHFSTSGETLAPDS